MEADGLRPLHVRTSESASADRDSIALLDEQLAVLARQQFREIGIPALDADEAISVHLDPGERVLGLRRRAVTRRIHVDEASPLVVSSAGSLYVTDRRLIHLAGRPESIELVDIDELSMADGRILVTLHGSRGLTLDVDDPHQLRVLIAAAKAALRTQGEVA